jgi:integrase/recombinase XerC
VPTRLNTPSILSQANAEKESNTQLCLHYLDHLRTQRKLSPHTLKSYHQELQHLIFSCDSLLFHQIHTAHIRQWITRAHAEGLNPRSIAHRLSCWRTFFDWLAQQITLSNNPVENIKAPKRAKNLPHALSPDNAIRLVSTLSQTNHKTLQICNQAMFELLYSSGLRVSELVSLDIQYTHTPTYTSLSWVDKDNQEVKVTGKGNKQRAIPVGQAALHAIEEWLSIRDSVLKTPTPALFLNEQGKRISVRSVQLRIKAHAQQLGIPANVHPHMLRHSFASHILQSSGDLRAVQEMLGHESITATQIYTELDFQRLATVYDQAHPRAKKKNNPKSS